MLRTAVLSLGFFLLSFSVFALDEIRIDQTAFNSQTAGRYEVTAVVTNQTADPREVTLRVQLFFFEQASPRGQRPAMILRKDETLVLNSGENRQISVPLFNEGSFPKERLRLEPEVRVRRQRIWHY